MKRIGLIAKVLFQFICCVLCLIMTVPMLQMFVANSGNTKVSDQSGTANYGVMDRFEQFVTNSVSDAMDGVLAIKKVYWLSDSDLIAPEPNPDCYGSSSDPAVLQRLIDDAAELLEGQELLFKADTPLYGRTEVKYYYDPTILALTWKQKINNSIYNISEIKIADASQFRRFMSDGEFLSGSKYLTSEMASSVNAVVAANGDYYAMRHMGMIINNGQLLRDEGYRMDSCAIDANGDMHFIEQGELTKPEDMQKYIDENGIRFSLAFGPVLVEDGKQCVIKTVYPVGEAKIPNARAAICQLDSLHYLVVLATVEPPYDDGISLNNFARTLAGMGIDKAYNLDGGRSATLVMNDTLQNFVSERLISDIIYFATAIPDGE